ncbi:hypothetical protein GCM10019059_33080 [Camelimonas fluminis]|uniref:Wzz/FepE/Etk N-terminal domain-containing protein n=1 Tax=Camelimonas fluminis TaxID=1576911 RepID=A0ABV7UGG9_9HYPH|nr:Wzz/FepE/Etk N-terminal domain-containing protein [Camelimonas fluminis]GHE70825.1 hypothetical protein GCM10019059_33080 [Camelimonas fluminis]
MDLRYQGGPAAARDLPRDLPNDSQPAARSEIVTSARVLARRWPMIATVALIFLGAGVAYIRMASPQYRAAALVSIDTRADAVVRTMTEPLDFNIQSAKVDSQVEILQSEELIRSLAGSVAKDASLLAMLQPGGLSLSSVKSGAREWLSPGAAAAKDAAGDTAGDLVRQLQARTTVKRVGLTHLIEISARAATPAAAAQIANAYARVFIDDQLKRREEIARRTSQALQARADELQHSAQVAQNAVEQLKFSGSPQDENSAAARVRLQTLESTARAYRDVHDRFLARYVETWQQQFLSVPEAQIVSRAFPPGAKAWPRALLILSALLLVGVSLGSVMALVLRRSDRHLG